jgi:L-ascorbate metabolism protein UlaG (beta-lactamase superfamily)
MSERTRETPAGAVTVIGERIQAYYDGRPCFFVITAGAHDAYFAPDTAILGTTDEGGGRRGTYYVPGGEFRSYAQRMIEIGRW